MEENIKNKLLLLHNKNKKSSMFVLDDVNSSNSWETYKKAIFKTIETLKIIWLMNIMKLLKYYKKLGNSSIENIRIVFIFLFIT